MNRDLSPVIEKHGEPGKCTGIERYFYEPILDANHPWRGRDLEVISGDIEDEFIKVTDGTSRYLIRTKDVIAFREGKKQVALPNKMEELLRCGR
jgi:hypothetical protein